MHDMSTRDERAEGVAEAFASLRLEGMEPTPDVLNDAQDYIEGRRSLDEIIEDVILRYSDA
jgi:hypothetical protein